LLYELIIFEFKKINSMNQSFIANGVVGICILIPIIVFYCVIRFSKRKIRQKYLIGLLVSISLEIIILLVANFLLKIS
jgi:hypothetical protein